MLMSVQSTKAPMGAPSAPLSKHLAYAPVLRSRFGTSVWGPSWRWLAVTTTALACTGAHVNVRADAARYPVSFSDGILDEGGALHLVGRDLEVVGTFEERYMEWSTLYGTVHGDQQADLSEALNAAVQAHGGEGVVRLQVQAGTCAFDWFWILNWLPFWPGCTVVDVEGLVVRRTSNRVVQVTK